MKKVSGKISKDIQDTAKIAEDFLAQVLKTAHKSATVVGLYGDLGTGKTTFVKAIAKMLGIKRKVSSPTFVIVKKYPIWSKKHDFLFHLDLYRFKNAKELLHIGWKDMIANPRHIVFIEWPENIPKAMPKNHHKVSITHTKEGNRNFKTKISK